MWKRLNKAALLAEIQHEYAALEAVLGGCKPWQMKQGGATRGDWSVKDILAHLLEWQQLNLAWYAAGLRREQPVLPALGYTWRELPRLPEAIDRKHQRRSVAAVLRDFYASHVRLFALIETLSDAELTALGRDSWAGAAWALSDYVQANTAAHYR